MSATESGTQPARAYGKRSSIKRRQLADASGYDREKPPDVVAKRPRISGGTRTPTPDADTGTDVEESTPVKSKVQTTYGSPRKYKSPSPDFRPGPSKPVRNLSGIFDSLTPSTSPSATPTKLAKRMLARSKTESSIESHSSGKDGIFDRTPSLPAFPSSPSRSTHIPPSVPRTSAPLLSILPSSSKSTTTRTYAGKFRSYLVTVPTSNNFAQSLEEDESETRESYSSLRSRWGVDNSEDDPHPRESPSPTRSASTTSEASPSRYGKGRSKSNAFSVRPPALPMGMMNPLKSISELRNKGESRRFLDEVGYLFEGLDKTGGIGLRRASALEIATKLCDAEFTRKAKAADFFSRTWDLFMEAGAGNGEDKVLDILLVFFLALVARDASSLSELAERPSLLSSTLSATTRPRLDDRDDDDTLVDILVRVLSTINSETDLIRLGSSPGADDAAFKKAGVSKKDRTILVSVYKVLSSKTNIFYVDTPLSTPLLIAYILQALPPTFISLKHLPAILNSLQLALSLTPSSTLASQLSSKWTNHLDGLAFEAIYYHLRLLDSYLLGQWTSSTSKLGSQSYGQQDDMTEEKITAEDAMNRARDYWLAADLVSFGVCTELKQLEDPDSFPLQKYLDTALRLLVSLTHSDETWGRKVVECEFSIGFLIRIIFKTGQELQEAKNNVIVKSEESLKIEPDLSEDQTSLLIEQTDSQALDTLCLALGLLTNLVQSVDLAKQRIRTTRLNPSCTLKKRVCAKSCTCSQPLNGLEILADLYVQQQTRSQSSAPSTDATEAQSEAEASFLRGHLAVLFGLLMMGNSENQTAILQALPSNFSVASSTSAKAKAIKISERSKLSQLVDQAKDFVAFYTVVSNRLGDGEKESKVAKDVVNFLTRQRDLAS